MQCAIHNDRPAVGACVVCGNLICADCDVLLAAKHYCRPCLASAERVPGGAP